ncbi:MAG: bifunctional phosphoribosyl-AMP cyclohydrolase/phosphoribosyl-ATP diphosphatase HisIE [Lachnospiraceae bacterium]
MEEKRILACIDTQNETKEAVLALAAAYDTNGVDGLFVYNYSKEEKEKEALVGILRELRKVTDLPFLAGCYVERLEDAKKVYYAGADKLVVDMDYVATEALLSETVTKFGKDKVLACMNCGYDYKEERLQEILKKCREYLAAGVYGIMVKHVTITPEVIKQVGEASGPVFVRDSLQRNSITNLFELPAVVAIATNFYKGKDVHRVKQSLKESGIPVKTQESPVSFAEMKKGENGLVPVIVQDYKTNEVLMLAYMNEEAYNNTVRTGRMTYYSRSRQELWLKGETSGHYQYVKSLSIDCDNDTLLAKVKQIGAACHTGNRSCFYRELISAEYETEDASRVLEHVAATVHDRKLHPKEGSYTNYLFDKGIDKILKKCGEEATEIVIAAKNPDSEELKYEIADFLYHVTVLMEERGLSWEDVFTELANRK